MGRMDGLRSEGGDGEKRSVGPGLSSSPHCLFFFRGRRPRGFWASTPYLSLKGGGTVLFEALCFSPLGARAHIEVGEPPVGGG